MLNKFEANFEWNLFWKIFEGNLLVNSRKFRRKKMSRDKEPKIIEFFSTGTRTPRRGFYTFSPDFKDYECSVVILK